MTSYQSFCKTYLLGDVNQYLGSLPATPEIVSLWLAHLATRTPHDSRYPAPLKFSSIEHYLSNFSAIHSCLGIGTRDNPCYHVLTKRTLKGIKRIFFQYAPERLRKRVRKELTPDLLALIGPHISNKSRDVRQASLWAALNCGVWGMMRSGEFTVKSTRHAIRLRKKLCCGGLVWVMNGYPNRFVQMSPYAKKRGDGKWEIHEFQMFYDRWSVQQVDLVYLRLSNTKTGQFEEEALTRIMGAPAIEALWNYLSLRNKVCPTVQSDWLFVSEWAVNEDGSVSQQPLAYHELLTALRTLISRIGLNPKEYSGHSLRRGGATALANARVDKGIIKGIGRWKSDESVDDYIRIDEQVLKDAVHKLVELELKKSPTVPANRIEEDLLADRILQNVLHLEEEESDISSSDEESFDSSDSVEC